MTTFNPTSGFATVDASFDMDGNYIAVPHSHRVNGDGRLMVNGAYNAAGYAVGMIPEGYQGRKEFEGPLVPGPWAYASPLAMVIDNRGGTAREIEKKREAGRLLVVDPGDRITVQGHVFEVALDDRRDVKLNLVLQGS